MYQLLIVEDEKWEREGLRDFLDWGSLGIEVAGCACNGVEGMEMAKLYCPQIIITDIMMPKLDGLRMSRNIRAFLPDTIIIILSGYDDFQYAKQSFDFHAFAYLLKPVQKKPFEEVLLYALKTIEHEESRKKERDTLEGQWMDYISSNRDQLLLDLLEGKMELKHINEFAAINGLNASGRKIVAILSFCLDPEKPGFSGCLSDNCRREVMNAFDTMLDKKKAAVSISKSLKEAVVCMDAPDTLWELETELLQLSDGLKKKLGMEVVIGIGEVAETLAEAPQSYYQAREASSFRFLADYGELLFYSKMKDADRKQRDMAGQLIQETNHIADKIVYGIQKGDIDESIRLMEDSLATLRENRSMGKMLLNKFITSFVREFNIVSPDGTYEFIREMVWDVKKLYLDISTLDSLSQARQYFIRFLKNMIVPKDGIKNYYEDDVVKRVIELIEDRYADELDLKLVSEEIYLSPYYIGSIFKKHTGKMFTQYLNDYRINKAKELLQSRKIKVYHLAEAVGIRNTSYFCTLFKSKFSVSPGEYKELLKGGREGV